MPDHAIIMLPYVYTQEVMLPRKRAVSIIHRADLLPVEVPVLSASEAPITLEATDSLRNDFVLHDINGVLMGRPDFAQYRKTKTSKDGDGKKNYPVQHPDDPKQNTYLTKEGIEHLARQFVDGHIQIYWPDSPIDLHADKLRWSQDIWEADAPIRSILKDNQEEAIDKAIAASRNNYAIIDGLIYAKEEEPIWNVETRSPHYDRAYGGRISLHRGYRQNQADNAFRLDRWNDVVQFVSEWCGGEVGENDVTDHYTHAWVYEDHAYNAKRWGWDILNIFENYAVSVLRSSREVINEVLNLRDSIQNGSISLPELWERSEKLRTYFSQGHISSKNAIEEFDYACRNMRLRAELFNEPQNILMNSKLAEVDSISLK